MTTIDTLTDEQIDTLRDEAQAAGDLAMVDLCTEALSNSAMARAEVVRVIRDQEARG